MKILIITIGLILLIWAGFTFFTETRIEKPSFKLIEKQNGYEIRHYDSYLVATTPTEGDLKQSLSEGFQVLAGYIFGGNNQNIKIRMTAPVTETVSSKGKSVQFMIPKKYTLNTLPKPDNTRIEFEIIPTRKMATLSFSGYATKSRVAQKKSTLLKRLKNDNIPTLSPPIYAGYNSPFAFPLMRRNEILVEIEFPNPAN